MLNPPPDAALFDPALCNHCPTPTAAVFLLVTDHAEHVCAGCLDTLAAHHDWQAAA